VNYRAVVAGWHDFYTIAGTAAATLVGLLFVGLSLHLRAVLSRSEVRSLARVTLTNFGLLLLLSLFLSIPQDAASASVELLVSGCFSLVASTPSLAAAARSRTRTLGLLQLLMRFGISTLSYAGVIVAGVLLSIGSYSQALNALVAVSVALFTISLRNSWDLLVGLGAATFGGDAAVDEPHATDRSV
jgi:hypothetical protein